MVGTFSSNASLTKTRAMFARRLTRADYFALSSKGDISQVVAYLKNHPGYSDVLSGVNERTVHRAELENCIREKQLASLSSLCRFEVSLGEAFSGYILLSGEIALLLDAMTSLLSDRESTFKITVPDYMRRHLRIDAELLQNAQTFEDIVGATRDSVFYPDLQKLASAGETPSLMEFEIALFRGFYRDVSYIAEKKMSKNAGAVLKEIIVRDIDLLNLIRIIRLKKYFSADEAYVKSAILPYGSISNKSLDKLLACEDEAAVIKTAQTLGFAKPLRLLSECHLRDDLPHKYLLEMAMHNIRFTPYPPIVIVSYLRIISVEISNIIRIVEGIRYGLAPDEIMGLLIISAKE